MKTQKHIDQFSLILSEILNEELTLGNQINETSEGWPDEKSIIIILSKPFKSTYHKQNVEFRNIDDPHYWKDEYIDSLTRHILACKF